MKTGTNDPDSKRQANCNVNSVFNFVVGGLAIAAAFIIAYLAYTNYFR